MLPLPYATAQAGTAINSKFICFSRHIYSFQSDDITKTLFLPDATP
jgi:hypothetical protein